MFNRIGLLFREFDRMNPNIIVNGSMESITDQVFCLIQNDHRWMKRYLDTVAQTGNLQSVNSRLARLIRDHYGLRNSGVKQNHPHSTLIQGYHELIR